MLLTTILFKKLPTKQKHQLKKHIRVKKYLIVNGIVNIRSKLFYESDVFFFILRLCCLTLKYNRIFMSRDFKYK